MSKLVSAVILSLTVLFMVPDCFSATIEVTYRDEEGEGFYDETPLSREERKLFGLHDGNKAATLGEARRNAFRYAADLLESRLANDNIIRVIANFFYEAPPGATEEDPCPIGLNQVSAQGSQLGSFILYGEQEPSMSSEGHGIDFVVRYPVSLAEAISGRELNGQRPDIGVSFNSCKRFYYGFLDHTFATSIYAPSCCLQSSGSFVPLAMHEMMHGMGFNSLIKDKEAGLVPETTLIGIKRDDNGNIELVPVVGEDEDGNLILQDGVDAQIVRVRQVGIYDMHLYSEIDKELLINLPRDRVFKAIISPYGNTLSWEGTGGGRNACSYGQRMAETNGSSLNKDYRSQDGRPYLAVSSNKVARSSVVHLHRFVDDIMHIGGSSDSLRMDVSLGMLKDMGWEIDYEGFPPSCVPTGVTVTPVSGLVTTESGREASFSVVLDSEPMGRVTIPLRSGDPDEGMVSPRVLEFIPRNWDTPRNVTVRGVNDNERDGPQDYAIILEEIKSDDMFYDGFDPQDVMVTNEDDGPIDGSGPISTNPSGNRAEGSGGGGCAIATAANRSESAVLNLFLIISTVLLFGVHGFPYRKAIVLRAS